MKNKVYRTLYRIIRFELTDKYEALYDDGDTEPVDAIALCGLQPMYASVNASGNSGEWIPYDHEMFQLCGVILTEDGMEILDELSNFKQLVKTKP